MGVELDPQLAEGDKKRRSRRFAKVRRGLDPSEVDDFLVTIASRIEALEAELHQDRITPEVPPEQMDLAQALPPAPTFDGSEGEPTRVARLGAVGEREVERMLAEAKAEAAAIVAEARSEADRIRSDAEAEAGRSVEEARAFLTKVEADAGQMLSNVAVRRRQMIEEFQEIQEHVATIAQELDLVLNPAGPADADVAESSTSVETGAAV